MLKFCDELRQAVLQEAIQGKLTEQLPSDGYAGDLLKQIKTEKERLVKEKKIKKEKELAPISDDDIPFDIPENWCWVRLGEIGETNIGLTYKPSDITNDGVIVLRSSNIQDERMDYSDIVRVSCKITDKNIAQIGDILICVRNGSRKLVGKCAIVDAPDMAFGAFMAIYRSKSNPYVKLMLNSRLFRQDLDGVNTTTINQITQSMIKNQICPLPPLAEQQRIVAKVEKLMAEIDELEKIEEELISLKKGFPGDMKAALLQEAMQGKLTEQLPSDGDARDLLKQIKAEKEKLVKEKKIKKEKELAPISDDEIPFDIPENWEWVRLGEISSYAQSKSKISAEKASKDRWLLDLEDIEKGGKLIAKKSVGESSAKGDKTIFYKGNILYSKLRPYLLKVLEADEDGICTPELIPFSMYGNINNSYVIKYLKSPYVDEVINSVTYGVKMPRVGTETMVNLCFPLPPLAEQQRIVAKLDKLLPLVDDLRDE